MNIEKAKEFLKTHGYDPECDFDGQDVVELMQAFAEQAVEAERERIRAGIEAIRFGDYKKFTRHGDALDAALAVVDGGKPNGTN